MCIRGRYASQSIVALAGALLLTGCAHGRRPGSYLPVGATGWYGNSTNDGVAVTLRRDAAAASAVIGTWRAAGYDIDRAQSSDRILLTLPCTLGGDTTMLVTAQILPIELPDPGASVTLTAIYSVPSLRVVRAPVVQRPGETSALFGRSRVLGDSLRAWPGRAPWRRVLVERRRGAYRMQQNPFRSTAPARSASDAISFLRCAMKSFIQLFLALVAHSASHPLLAQRVEAGARVRIETRDGLVRTGDVIDLHADSLTVQLDRTGASLGSTCFGILIRPTSALRGAGSEPS